MGSQVLVALALSLLGGLSTSIGALFVVLNPAPNLKMLGLLQGFAAGLMLSISFLDLAHNAINSIGFLKGNLWFFAGVIFFAFVANFIPEPTLAPVPDVKRKKKNGDEGGKDIMKKHRRQVLFSGIVTAIGISLHNFPEGMAVFLGSMKGLRVGLNLALAIALHNIPEGVAVALPVYFATERVVEVIAVLAAWCERGLGWSWREFVKSCPLVRWSIAIGINVHSGSGGNGGNGGVGMLLVGMYFGRKVVLQDKWQAFKLATLSGLAEPLGVIIVAYLFPSSLSPEILEGLLASVGGVMAFLTLHEMLPLAFDYAGQKQAVKAVFIGMAFMSASLYFLEISLPADMSL
uniref:Zinc transporter ZTP29 n=1 Tax=Fagus sylvatica TaxID=28930 RepID=A0A2N9I5E7_FAGSY